MNKKQTTYRFIAAAFLLLFTMLIITPMIVTIVNKDKDISMFYNMTEEENHKTTKITSDILHNSQDIFAINLLFPKQKTSYSFYKEKLNVSLYSESVSPPPEYVS